MTVLHKDEPLSFKDKWSESHCCVYCGYNTNPGAPPRELAEFLMHRDGNIPMAVTADAELYMVRDAVWKAAGMEPYGGCLCVGCLEKRIGRKLKPKDFKRDHLFNSPEMPCTDRLRNRRGGYMTTATGLLSPMAAAPRLCARTGGSISSNNCPC